MTSDLSEKNKEKFENKRHILQKYNEGILKAAKAQGKKFRKRTFINEFVAAHSISSGTLYRWLADYKKLGDEGLIPKRGNHLRGTGIMEHLNYLIDPLIEPGKPIKLIIREFIETCKIHGISHPSDSTVRKYINKNYKIDLVPEKPPSGPTLVTEHTRVQTATLLPIGISELDRVLGGGFYIPSSVVLAGEPGVGKSTLMSQVAVMVSKSRGPRACIYFSAEQSREQMVKRLIEIDPSPNIYIDDTDSLEQIIETIKKKKPSLSIIDSIKRVRTQSYTGAFDSPYYVSYCGKQLKNLTRQTKSIIVMINHITKSGDMAGLKSLEHDVDVTLFLQGNPLSGHRTLYASKNRYSDTTEVGFFMMTEKGLKEIESIDLLFRRKRSGKVTGVALVVVKKGHRTLLVEIQSLLTDISSKSPSINTTGLNKDQIIKIVRILKERLNINVSDLDITMSTTGEIEIDYPYIQLAIAASILSFVYKKDVSRIVFIGEIDLTGYIHSFYGLNKLLEEVKKIKDVKSIYSPPLVDMKDVNDPRINFVENIFDLQNKLFSE